MCNAVIAAIALAFFLSVTLAPPSAVAQSGSAGGSIGNDEKSLSGSRSDRSAEPAPSARRSKPAEEPRSSSRRGGGGGGGGGSFDGAWMVVSVGCGGTTSGAVVVSSEPDRKRVSGFGWPVIPSDLQRFEGGHHAMDQGRSYPVSAQRTALHK